VFPDAKRNKASYGLNSVAYEGVVSEKSTKIFLDDAEFTRVKRTSVWEIVEKFAKIHKVKLTPEDLRLVHRAKTMVVRTSDTKVLNRMPVRGDEILTESGWLRVGPKRSESAFGIVFSAEWEQFGNIPTDKNTKVFLKVSLPGKEKDFDRECRIMEIMHGVKGFPWVHGQNLEGTHHFYFTNWVGESLSEMLNSNKGKFPANGLVVVAAQVLQHLQSLHKANLVMLDLSPDNVFIDHKAKVYLTELGLARELKDKSSSVREELKNFLKLMRYIRSVGRQDSDASVWIQLEDYMAAHESPDLKTLEKILVKQWGALSD
jgi:tRNA A-37 threonylcarbamoyl transferase component Bud32